MRQAYKERRDERKQKQDKSKRESIRRKERKKCVKMRKCWLQEKRNSPKDRIRREQKGMKRNLEDIGGENSLKKISRGKKKI